MYFIILIFIIAFLYFATTNNSNKTKKTTTVHNTNIGLISMSLLESDKELIDLDKKIYDKYYQNVSIHYCSSRSEFSKIVNENNFNLVHLIININKTGRVIYIDDEQLQFKSLLSLLAKPSIKIVLIASDNPSEYINEVDPKLIRADIIMTLNRMGDNFSKFYTEIFSGMSKGRSLYEVWFELSPQNPNAIHKDCPDSIVAAGNEIVILK